MLTKFRVPLGQVAAIAALFCTGRELLRFSATPSPVERLRSCVCEWAIMLWFIALAIMLAHYQRAKRFTDELLRRDGRPWKYQECQSLLDWISRSDVGDHDGSQRIPSNADSFYFKGAVGPSSRVPARSSKTGSSLSLLPNAPCPDARRSARLNRVIYLVSLGRFGTDRPVEDPHE